MRQADGRVTKLLVEKIIDTAGQLQIGQKLLAEQGQVGDDKTAGGSARHGGARVIILDFRVEKELPGVYGEFQIEFGQVPGRVGQRGIGLVIAGILVGVTQLRLETVTPGAGNLGL